MTNLKKKKRDKSLKAFFFKFDASLLRTHHDLHLFSHVPRLINHDPCFVSLNGYLKLITIIYNIIITQ